MFHKSALLKENTEHATRLQDDSTINKQSRTSKVKVELFGDKGNEKDTTDDKERTIVEVEEHEASELPQADLQTY